MTQTKLSFAPLCALALIASAANCEERWATPDAEQQYAAELHAFFDGAEVRFPGSPGNLKIEEQVAQVFAASGFEKHGEIRFQTPVFRPGHSLLTLNGAEYVIQALHPAVMRPGNFKQDAFDAPLIYLRRGTEADLDAVKGLDLAGCVAVLDFDCGANWMRLLRFGVKGYIFSGQSAYDAWDVQQKVYGTETATARFFLPEADGKRLVAAISASKTPPVAHFECKPSTWANAYLRDLWVVIPGSDERLKNDVCVITAPLDSNCIVPERAEGAQAGANLYLLMRLLKSFQQTPPARTVLLAAVNAHTQNYLGERMLAMHLLSAPNELEAMRDLFRQDARLELMYAAQYKELYDKLAAVQAAPGDSAALHAADDTIADWRTKIDSSTGKQLPVKKPLISHLSRAANEAKSLEVDPQLGAEKSKEHDRLLDLQMLFNKYGAARSVANLNAQELETLLRFVKLTLNENAHAAELNQADLDLGVSNNEIRVALQSRNVPWVLCLDLSWRGGQIGFCSGEFWGNPDWRNRFGGKLVELAENLPGVKAGRRNLLADTMRYNSALPEAFYFSVPQDVACFQAIQNTPAFCIKDVFSYNGAAFSPIDTFAALDAAAVAETSLYSLELLREMAAADASSIERKKLNRRAAWSIQVKAMQYDPFSSEVLPEIPVENAFVAIRARGAPPAVNDVVLGNMQLTDARATATFYAMREYWVIVHSSAFEMDRDYREVLRTLDGGEKNNSLSSNASQARAQTYVMFPCREFPIYTRDDSSAIGANPITMTDYKPLDARRESAPQEAGAGGIATSISGVDKKYFTTPGPGSLYFSPRISIKLLCQLPALHSTDAEPEGIGFASPEELGPDFYTQAAHDLDRLNRYRLGRLHGVSIELATDFLKKGKAALAVADEKKNAHDYIGFLQAQQIAVGAERQAYGQLGATTNDMLRGVIFYMALILPFCFFMQKLLFNFVKVEAQILTFLALFFIAYILFREIHPAFAVAKAPEGILIAFCMGGLATFVIKILHGRFEGEMALLFQNYSGSDAADVGYGTVGQKAMLIGVNNMRRRRVRTALTTATIVLITFTMLSFTSISQTMSPTIVSVSKEPPPYAGIMHHWPGKRMDEATLTGLREMFYGKGDVIVRRWLLPPVYNKMTYPFAAVTPSGKVARIDSALGLSVLEDGLLGKFPLLAGRYFSSDNASEVIVPARVAEALGIDRDHFTNAKLRLTNSDADLTVVGIVDDEAFRRLKDLDGYLIIPQKEGLTADDTGAAAPTGGAEGGNVASDQSGLYHDTSSMLILPVERSAMFGATPYSVSVRFNAQNMNIWQNVLQMITVTQANFYTGSPAAFKAIADDGNAGEQQSNQTLDAGVYYIGSGSKTSTNNLSSLIIPLLISGTIILNTMLGSVFERKKEIAIYNAVGLNPNHIGMFFLSEAFVYGIIGSVGGYLIGQILSILLIHSGITGIDLNFASLKVIYVIVFTIAMVLLSTLYPAMVATRAAVPSGKRKWAFPAHDGHTMELVFPFIYQPAIAPGVMTYLDEYFQRFTEASMGDLIASEATRSRGKDAKGRDTYMISYNTALAPFDLGVTQQVTFTAAYNERVQSYGITLTSVRISGQDTNWVTTNKPFLERLRAYLMHWRSLTPQEQSEYAKHFSAGASNRETTYAL